MIHPGAQAKLDKFNVRPHFEHHRYPDGAPRERAFLLTPKRAQETFLDPRGGVTVCRLLNSFGAIVLEVEARCHPEDVYCKQTGRDIALRRALRELR